MKTYVEGMNVNMCLHKHSRVSPSMCVGRHSHKKSKTDRKFSKAESGREIEWNFTCGMISAGRPRGTAWLQTVLDNNRPVLLNLPTGGPPSTRRHSWPILRRANQPPPGLRTCDQTVYPLLTNQEERGNSTVTSAWLKLYNKQLTI